MTELRPPATHFGGRTWSPEELGALAVLWHRELGRQVGPEPPLVALVPTPGRQHPSGRA
jgi:hypothetical protein